MSTLILDRTEKAGVGAIEREFPLLLLAILLALLTFASNPQIAFADQNSQGHENELIAQDATADFYAVLYKDGHLIFQAANNGKPSSPEIESIFECALEEYGSANRVPWHSAANKITTVSFDDSFKNIRPKSLNSWFCDCKNMVNIDLENLDASKSTTMEKMFKDCASLTQIDGIESMNTSSSTYFGSMFSGCSRLKSLDLSRFDATHVTVLCFMFNGCSSLENLNMTGPGWKTSSLGLMVHVWEGCSSLKSLDLSMLDTTHVRSMTHDFDGCSSLESLDLSNVDTSHQINLISMFDGCESLNTIKLGAGFSFFDGSDARQCDLPEGMWKSSADGLLHSQNAIPNNISATYTRQSPSDNEQSHDGIDDAPGSTKPTTQNPSATGQTLANGAVFTRGLLSYKIVNNSKRTVIVKGVAGSAKKATIPARTTCNGKRYTVIGIARSAFKGSKLKALTIKSKKLTKKRVRGCFKGAAKLTVVKVPKQKKSLYRAFFKKSHCGRSVKVR